MHYRSNSELPQTLNEGYKYVYLCCLSVYAVTYSIIPFLEH